MDSSSSNSSFGDTDSDEDIDPNKLVRPKPENQKQNQIIGVPKPILSYSSSDSSSDSDSYHESNQSSSKKGKEAVRINHNFGSQNNIDKIQKSNETISSLQPPTFSQIPNIKAENQPKKKSDEISNERLHLKIENDKNSLEKTIQINNQNEWTSKQIKEAVNEVQSKSQVDTNRIFAPKVKATTEVKGIKAEENKIPKQNADKTNVKVESENLQIKKIDLIAPVAKNASFSSISSEESDRIDKKIDFLNSPEVKNPLKYQSKIQEKNSIDSVSSIDSRPSERPEKEKFNFEFPKDPLKDTEGSSKAKPQANPDQNAKKINLSSKYNLTDSNYSSSSDDSYKDEAEAPAKEPEEIKESPKPKYNIPPLKLNADKSKKAWKVQSVKNIPEADVQIVHKIPELKPAAKVGEKLKNNPSVLQNEEVKEGFAHQQTHEEIGLNIPRSSLDSINIEIDELKYYSFEDALQIFKKIKIPPKSMKNPGFFSKFCGCCGASSVKLTQEQTDDCEKMLGFSYVDFDMSVGFHKSLLLSVYGSLTSEKNWPSGTNSWKKIGISSFEKEIKGKGVPEFLLFMLFMTNYFTNPIKDMLQESNIQEQKFPFTVTLLKLGNVVIKVLNENKLNKFIKSNNKTLEVIFFFYAGVVLYWHKIFTQSEWSVKQLDNIYNKTLKKAMGGPNDLILSARSVFAKQGKDVNL
ncbi:unnamed protein product [Blepharisma stoltei]|uniref:ELMO domain-containing protein n=1 Tax=Blepharisma stoltei TaxID=1481888 RepID=A0AAU9I9R0_9CILI|nr:unnamed protein product [Blepharisma stoltei]